MPSLATTAMQAYWFAPLVVPICLWAAYSDLKHLRIPNYAVLALMVTFVVLGLFALPTWPEYLWRYAHFAIALGIGFLLWVFPGIGFGAGDAKFAAAIAPFVAREDLTVVLLILCATTLVGLALHKTARLIPAVRRATPDWVSWEDPKAFPWGVSLSAALILYLVLAIGG